MRGTREAILNAAMDVFSRKGYAGSSIREICAEAGITKPVLYYHFRNKGHLFEELMVDSFGYYLKTLLRASRIKGSLRQKLIHISYNDLCAAKASPARIRFMLRMIFAAEEQRPYFNFIEEMEKQRQVIAGVLLEGIQAGEMDGDPRQLATALIGMNLIAILENMFTGKPTLSRKSAENSVDILLPRRVSKAGF
jgi:TetR/AcrR family transcriptional regulator